MNYSKVKNPIWANENHTMINCEVLFDNFAPDYLPFSATTNDTSNPSSSIIFNECANEVWGQVLPYIPPQPYMPTDFDNKQTAILLLQQTDWTTIADVGNPQMANPYLVNQAAFIAWRSQIRAIAVTPIAGNLDIFNQMPQEEWKTV